MWHCICETLQLQQSTFFPLCTSAQEIEGDSWAGVVLALFSLPSSAGMVSSRCGCPLGAGSHGGVVLGKGAALLPGGICWQRQLSLCVSSKSYCISCPFCPLSRQPPFSNPVALTSASPRAVSACEHVCVRSSLGCVRRPRPIRLASTDVTGLEEC